MDKIARNYILTKDLIEWLNNTAKQQDLSASAYLRRMLRQKQAEERPVTIPTTT